MMSIAVSVKSVLMLVWVLAIIVMTAYTIGVWQESPAVRQKRTMCCLLLAVLFAVPCVLFLMFTP